MQPYQVIERIRITSQSLIKERQEAEATLDKLEPQIEQCELDHALMLRFVGRALGNYTTLALHQRGYIDDLCRITALGNQRIEEIFSQYADGVAVEGGHHA